jgi:hypothetical protein
MPSPTELTPQEQITEGHRVFLRLLELGTESDLEEIKNGVLNHCRVLPRADYELTDLVWLALERVVDGHVRDLKERVTNG